MENRIFKVGGQKNFSRKTRSLDLQSIYNSSISKEGVNKSNIFDVENEVEVGKENKKTKRRSRSRKDDGLLTRLGSEGKKRRKHSNRENSNELRSVADNSDWLFTSLSQKLSSGNASTGISLSLDQNRNVFWIPKRRRASGRRKRFGGDSGSRPLGEPSSVDQVVRINGEVKKGEGGQMSALHGYSGGEVGSSGSADGKVLGSSASSIAIPKIKWISGGTECKDSKNNGVSLDLHAKDEDGLLVVNNGKTSCRKCQSNYRKRKNLSSGNRNVAKKTERLVDKTVSMRVGFADDDEGKNLGQNAARILSSRFDPSCTGLSSNTRPSLSPSTNGFSFMIFSDQDFVDQDVNSLTGSESSSVDNSSTVLRPRKKQKNKGLSRKRHHFFEILPRDYDAYWVLKRRIKVFWPLDKSWYYGLVIDYDPEKELHHIKYDDRDEEWINLQNEKFKLLLLPDEVPRKVVLKGSTKMKSVNEGKIADDDVYMGKCLDSEPIISWLAHSPRRVKCSSNPMKKQKISELPSSIKTFSSSEKVNDAKCNVESSQKHGTEIGGLSLPDRLTDGGEAVKSFTGRHSSSEARGPVVYFRKRFRKKGEESSSASGNGKECKVSHGTLGSLVPEISTMRAWKEYGTSFHGCSVTDKLLWVLDNNGSLRLSMQLIESERYRVVICLSSLPSFLHFFGAVHLKLFRTVSSLQYGAITTRWPVVTLEVLFVDNIIGIRSVSFEGTLEHSLALLFLILSVFKRHTEEGMSVKLHLPETSIRVKLSSVRDPRKQHVFAFHIFSKLKCSKWLYLDSELQRHCLVTHTLPLSECTYDNIMELECRRLGAPHADLVLLICEDLQKKSIQDVKSMCLCRESFSTMIRQSTSATKLEKLPPYAYSFNAAPMFFLSLHLKMLMNRSIACINLEDFDSNSSLEETLNTNGPASWDCRQVESYSEKDMMVVPVSDVENLLPDAAFSKCLIAAESTLEKNVIPVGDVGKNIKSSQDLENGELDVAESSASSKNFEENSSAEAAPKTYKCDADGRELEQPVTSFQPSVLKNIASSTVSSARGYSILGDRSFEIPTFDQIKRSLDERAHLSRQASDLTVNLTDVHSPCTIGPGSSWKHSGNSVSSLLGDHSSVWPSRKTNISCGVFSNGPKKPRTQVRYTMPFGGCDMSSKHKSRNPRSFHYKRIRRVDNRIPDGSSLARRSLELLACHANVLITIGDRGWRECGARVVLELADHNEWRLSVRVSGFANYSYKVHSILQPGSTNRYTHAMMWRGGKDWVLEFPDRSQWMLFKEMHEQCCNRNIRAASVKYIPVPGVRLIEETEDTTTNASFVRHSTKYIRQVENDVDMAINPLRVLYDMDSEDEQWLSENKNSLCTDKDKIDEISVEFFEKTMDMFEKIAYTQQREHFISDEIEELMVGVGTKIIYEHWQQKRQRKGMPLTRHLQPPLWEKYQQQDKHWEQAAAEGNIVLSVGCKERALSEEKPTGHAFCLKPQGLETPNKGSKQRSQKKLSVAMHNHAVSGDQDGRRLNGIAFGDERVVFPGNGVDSSEASPLLQASTRTFSPHDASRVGYFSLSRDVSECNHQPKQHSNTAKKIGGFPSPSYPPMMASYNKRTIGKRNRFHGWSMDVPEWPNQKHYYPEGSYGHSIQQLDNSELQEFRLHDASGSAHHALNMAKLRRERAQRLLYRADLAVHKAVVAIMTAEAIKADFEATSNGNG